MERSSGVMRTGKWCKEEDDLLKACVRKFGEGKWHLIPQRSGLKRCRKSCRLRWLNYLKPDIKRGDFTEDEVEMMIRLHRLLGNRWSLIAGRLPGRTPNDVKNFWNTHMREKGHGLSQKKAEEITMKTHNPIVIKPRAFSLSRNSSWWRKKPAVEVSTDDDGSDDNIGSTCPGERPQQVDEDSMEWWKSFLDLDNDIEKEGKYQNVSSLPSSFLGHPSLSSSVTEQDGKFDLFLEDELTWISDFPLRTNLLDFLA